MKLLEQNALKKFYGGGHPAGMKQLSNRVAIATLPLPQRFVVPIQQHFGEPGELLVAVGNQVEKWQPLTRPITQDTLPVHAPTSGIISAIALYPNLLPDREGSAQICIEIEADLLDSGSPLQQFVDYRQQSPATLIEKVRNSGIAGLGGAGFPAATKWSSETGLLEVEILIINAVECEPYITADDRLVREHAAAIIEGCQILAHILQPKQIVIAIEEDKPEAIQTLLEAIHGSKQREIALRILPNCYPSGSAKQLIYSLTGLEVPQGQHANSMGIIVQNVATIFAIQRAVVHGVPLIERVVSVTGPGVEEPGNFWIRCGTPIDYVLQHVGLKFAKNRVVVGGPMMGRVVADLASPVVKSTNCLLIQDGREAQPLEQPCIRCGDCAAVCPANLLPQQLYWFSRGGQHDLARSHNLLDCIECGACNYVCPSQIPLVDYYRKEKAELRAIEQQQVAAERSKSRFNAKQQRLESLKMERQRRYLEEAHELPRARQNQAESANQQGNSSSEAQDEISAAIARAKARRGARSPNGGSHAPPGE